MKKNNSHKDSIGKIDLEKNIKIASNKNIDRRKRIIALIFIKRFCLPYQTFQRRQPWEPLDPLMEKVVQVTLSFLEEDIEIISETMWNIPIADMRILRKLINILKKHKTKYGSYRYRNVKYTLRELILKQIKQDFQSIIKGQWYGAEIFGKTLPLIDGNKKDFIFNLIKANGDIDNEKIKRILDFLDPDMTPVNKDQLELVKKEKKIIEDLAYAESEIEEDLERILNIVDDYIGKKIESSEFKKHIDESEANEKRSRKERYRSRQCKICGKIFSGKEPTRIIHDETTGIKFVQPYDSQRISRLWAPWECLCNHIAERFFGSVLIQERMVNNKIADIIINDGSVKVNNDKKVTYANKIIEVKLGLDFQEGLRGSILKYIDYCNSMEFWLCHDLEQEDLQELFDRQLKDFGEKKIKSDKGEGTAAKDFYENEIEWIRKTRDIVGNKKIILKGWAELLKELKDKSETELIEALEEIVKEYDQPFFIKDRRFFEKKTLAGIGEVFIYKQNSPENQKRIEERFNKIIQIQKDEK